MANEPTRAEIDAMAGVTVLEFGASWCGFCQGARPIIDRVLAERPGTRHLWIEDGKGRRLGRTFAVKLWPTLIVMKDGREVARVVRPNGDDDVRAAISAA
jgi:thioredoxin 1